MFNIICLKIDFYYLYILRFVVNVIEWFCFRIFLFGGKNFMDEKN